MFEMILWLLASYVLMFYFSSRGVQKKMEEHERQVPEGGPNGA